MNHHARDIVIAGNDLSQLRRRAYIPSSPRLSSRTALSVQRRLLFIDFHGTLSKDVFWNALPPEHLRLIQREIFEDAPFVQSWMRGARNSRDACRYASSLTGLDEEYLFSTLLESCRSFSICPTVANSLQALREHFVTVLTTANMDCFAVVARHLRLLDLFDDVVNSADYGLLKEDEGGLLFQMVADAVGATLANATLIDDSQEVCSVFSNLGGSSIRVASVDETRAHLERLQALG